jgi:hypothetical protein
MTVMGFDVNGTVSWKRFNDELQELCQSSTSSSAGRENVMMSAAVPVQYVPGTRTCTRGVPGTKFHN